MGRLLTRRRFLRASLGAVAGAAGVGLYTWRLEPHWLEVVRRPLPIRGLPSALAGARLAHLTDLHVGPRVDDGYLLETFRRVEDLAPDLVVYTGDFISFHTDVVAHASRVLAHLPRGRLGTVGVLGNHDYGPGWAHPEVAAQIADLVRSAGVEVLRNALTDVAGLQIAGLDDLWSGRFSLALGLAGLDPARPAIVLNHNPDAVDAPGWDGYRGWILAGHTHGGQCRPPFLPPPVLPVRNKRYTAGEFALSGDRCLYVNRGVGHLLEVRFNVRPEVTVFELARAPDDLPA